MTIPQQSIWLRRFAKFVCFSTILLIFAGSMVTSTGSGLAVPDWPLSYGTFFPPMVGGVFYEHGHRMIATAVGFLMLCLSVWLAIAEKRKWIRNLGFYALLMVIIQGILGGVTVLFYLPTPISVIHGITAQVFFILTIVIAYSLSIERQERERQNEALRTNRNFNLWSVTTALLIFVQLILGAVMRHTGSGLSVPDFPTMGGYWLPIINDQVLANVNSWRFDHNLDPVSKVQIFYHLCHRLWALVILIAVCILNMRALECLRAPNKIRATIIFLDALIVIQINLGILTVLTEKMPIVTSLHVVTGALTLGTAVLLCLRVFPITFSQLQKNNFL